jgi:hypothetical protein
MTPRIVKKAIGEPVRRAVVNKMVNRGGTPLTLDEINQLMAAGVIAGAASE